MKDPKQTIVVRKDLKMRKGKIAAQASHASGKVFFDRMMPLEYEGNTYFQSVNWTPEMVAWKQGIFTKIVLGCDSEEDILDLESKAKALDIPYVVITDSGKTEFHGVPTITCIAIGPCKAEVVEELTKQFPLL